MYEFLQSQGQHRSLRASTSVPAVRLTGGPGLGHAASATSRHDRDNSYQREAGTGTVVQKIAKGATLIHKAREIALGLCPMGRCEGRSVGRLRASSQGVE